jgi:hypothetical protein
MSSNVEFMRALEERYRQVSGARNRSEYKIFYGQVFPAPILTLGLNPGGTPEGTSEDGTQQKDGSLATSSSSYFEQMENDILDCDWRENGGLRKLLLPLLDHDRNRFRNEIVKTNIAFRRSRGIGDIDLASAAQEAVPFLEQIIAWVNPRLIVLTGPSIDLFLGLYALNSRPLTETIKDPGVKHVVFAANAALLKSVDHETIVVQVAHASQFAWTYSRYDVSARIAELIGKPFREAGGAVSGDQRTSASMPTALPRNGLIAQSSVTPGVPAMRFNNPRLAELDSRWRDLGIGSQFHKVHHFESQKFSGKSIPLDEFIAWCDVRAIRAENAQTLERALCVARLVADGHDFKEALKKAWTAHPTVTR